MNCLQENFPEKVACRNHLQEAGGSSTICDVNTRSNEAENEDYEKIGLMLLISQLNISDKNHKMVLPSKYCTFFKV
jgi:hypothetical protein